MADGQAHDIKRAGQKAVSTIKAMLAAAFAGGYTQSDIHHTQLVRDERSKRLGLMARASCAAAANGRLAVLSEYMRQGKQ